MSTANVRVIVRVRPKSLRELSKSAEDLLSVDSHNKTVTITPPKHGLKHSRHKNRVNGPRTFAFDECFAPSAPESKNLSGQEDVYESTGPLLVKSILEGFNSCFITYGQKGTGKTYSVVGLRGQPGIIPHISESIFEEIDKLKKKSPNTTITVSISLAEIIEETPYDLLQPNVNSSHTPGETVFVQKDSLTGYHLHGLSEFEVGSAQEIDAFLRLAAKVCH